MSDQGSSTTKWSTNSGIWLVKYDQPISTINRRFSYLPKISVKRIWQEAAFRGPREITTCGSTLDPSALHRSGEYGQPLEGMGYLGFVVFQWFCVEISHCFFPPAFLNNLICHLQLYFLFVLRCSFFCLEITWTPKKHKKAHCWAEMAWCHAMSWCRLETPSSTPRVDFTWFPLLRRTAVCLGGWILLPWISPTNLTYRCCHKTGFPKRNLLS